MTAKTVLLILVVAGIGMPVMAQTLPLGNAMQLDGTDDYVWTPAILSAASEGTVEMWFRPDAAWGGEALWVGGIGHPGTNGDVARLGSHSTAGGLWASFGFYIAQWRWATSSVLPDQGRSYHIAGTWGSGGLCVYINGSLLGTHGYSGASGSYNLELIGTSSWGSYFEGIIDEVRIWSLARDSQQIQACMLDTLASVYTSNLDSGLVAYYRFEQYEDLGVDTDGADDFRDYSAGGHHADSRGGPTLVPEGQLADVHETGAVVPAWHELDQNIPNPFNAETIIRFGVPRAGHVVLDVFNVLGQRIDALVNEPLPPGSYAVRWDAGDLPSGVYFYRIRMGDYKAVRRAMLLR